MIKTQTNANQKAQKTSSAWLTQSHGPLGGFCCIKIFFNNIIELFWVIKDN